MPTKITNTVCPHCDKEFRFDNFAKHMMSHKEAVVLQMTEEQKTWCKTNRVPLLKVHNKHTNAETGIVTQKAFFVCCMHCKKYAHNESKRNNDLNEFAKQHLKSDCKHAFASYECIYNFVPIVKKVAEKRPIKLNPVFVDEAPPAAENNTNETLITKLFEMLGKPYDPEDYDEGTTTQDALIIEIETLLASRDRWQSRYEKLKASQNQTN